MHLVIVESPTKAKTIEKYLGNDYQVLASYGHVRDLIPKDGAIDTDTFLMKYEVSAKDRKHLEAIYKAAAEAESVLLATDPDREGEAISWHISELIHSKKQLSAKPLQRVAFFEITKDEIIKAISQPRPVSMDLVNAQQARRALDYLVGFKLSPLLWTKIKRGLSAGRVQSPALRLIVERELEIEAFRQQEYWTIEARLTEKNQQFAAQLIQFQGKKLDQFDIVNQEKAAGIKTILVQAAGNRLTVQSVTRKEQKRQPAAPFTTSTLQQEAARKLGFSARKTMMIAQQLFEGVTIGSETAGLITYMRTDSVNLSGQAIHDLRRQIESLFGPAGLPDKPRIYKTKTKNAQEAHEAIRPTSAARLPEAIQNYLSNDQFRLYSMIWKRSIACQMIPALIEQVTADLTDTSTENIYRASGSAILNPGFLSVYQEGQDDAALEEEENQLPVLTEGQPVNLNQIETLQHFTKPPARYSEASLIKTLESFGIGRPSTYASILSTLQDREYVGLDKKRFVPTDIGRVVNKFLTEHFTRYVDYEFTAHLEDDLDAISRGEQDWIPVMKKFWGEFKNQIDQKSGLERREIVPVRELGKDPHSGHSVTVRLGRFGPFAQIGNREEVEKPRFASLRPGQSLETITLEQAIELFNLPRILGQTDQGEIIQTNIGRFGPYVQYGKKYISLKKQDPLTITLEEAQDLIQTSLTATASKEIKNFEQGIRILNGRYGPYITDGKINAHIPKSKKPEELSLEECKQLLSEAALKPRKPRRGFKKS